MGTLQSGDSFASPLPATLRQRQLYPTNNLLPKSDRPNIAHDAGYEDDVYHQWSVVDATFFALKHRFDETVDTGTWFGQFG